MSAWQVPVLVAYPYWTKQTSEVLERHSGRFRLMVDSGAFTAWTQGHQIDLEDYARFLRRLPREWKADAIQLDVVRQPEATRANLLRMADMKLGGCTLMPVATRGCTEQYLEEVYEVGNYVAAGGTSGPSGGPWVEWISSRAAGRRLHWLGHTSVPRIKRWRPTSVDSSNVVAGQRYGYINYYDRGGKLGTVGKKQMANPPAAFVRTSRKRGFTVKELQRLGDSEAWRGAVRPLGTARRGLASLVHYTHHLARAHDVERHTGTAMFFATASAQDLQSVFTAMDLMAERGTL